jgi:tetratricopeptide (TPR) repeat protein
MRPRPGAKRATRATASLPNDVVAELRRSSKPGRDEMAISRLERAVALLQRGDASGAVTEATKAKELAPRAGTVREVLGLALYGRERYREALTEMQAYRRMTGRLDQNHIIADCFRATGQPDRAVPLAEEALAGQRVPLVARVESVVVAAAALADLGRFDQALAMLRRIRTSDEVGGPEALRIWYVTGDIMERAGRTEEAERAFRRIMRHDPTAYDVAERLAALGGSVPPRRRSSR